MTPRQLEKILKRHAKWLRGEGGKRAELCRAILSGANLRWENLTEADLRWAELGEADLYGAYLNRADLTNVGLRSTRGNGREIKSLHCGKYDIAYTATHMQIDCERHAIEDWWAFDDNRISEMDEGALDWWRVWKPILQQIIKASPAVPTGRER